MIKKLFVFFIVLLLPLFLSLPRTLSSQYSDKPSISIFKNNYNSTNGVIELSSIEEPKVQVASNQIYGPAKLEIYQTTIDDLLKYLLHDAEYKQTQPNVDTSTFTHLSSLDLNLTQAPQSISLNLPSSGIFYLRLKMGDLESQTYVVRSSFGTIAREAKNTLVTWSQDFTTKRSLVGGKATLYNLEKQKKIIGSALLDGDAVASLPLSKDADVIVVESQDSISVVPLNIQYLNYSYFWSTFQENKIHNRYFMFTDRPIYKPGDTVNFKAIVRRDDDARYSIPSGLVNIEVSQGEDNSPRILKDRLTINVNGFIGTSFVIPKNAKTGDYVIKINSAENIESQERNYLGTSYYYFKVENYRKPEYSINAESLVTNVIRGNPIDIKIKGEYYSGQPLSNANVSYTVYSSKYYSYEHYYPNNGDHYYRGWYGNQLENNVITLDSTGKAKITLPTGKYDSEGEDQIYFIDFSYIDDTGNPSTTGISVLVRSGEYSLYRDSFDHYGSKPNEKISLPLIVMSHASGLPLSKKINISIIRSWWEKIDNPDSKYSNYSQRKEDVGSYSVNSNNFGKAIFDFTPTKTGNYQLKTEIIDSRGNKINKVFNLWVSDQHYSYYNSGYGQDSSINVVTDKKSYQPGDIAIVNITSEIPDRDVFIGFERGYQDRYQIVRLTGKEKTIQTEITDHDAPNIYLSAKSFSVDSLAGSLQNITVNTNNKQAYFSLSTDKLKYAPGDEVIVDITAKDLSGKPLETNFALWSVDKSIFALADKSYGDIFDNFWAERGNTTVGANSLQGIYIDPAEKGGCFLSGTKIKMADGSQKSIEDIKIGEKILTRLSDSSSKLVETSVLDIHKTNVSDYLIINKTLQVTRNHFLYINKNWRVANTLQIGDELTDYLGNQIRVNSIENLYNQTPVYNLTTEKYHTYFANNFYVHNDKGGGGRSNFADTAYWNLSINTNSDGKAQVKFKLPDNLTTWVITALGATHDTRVGEAFTEIKVSKDLVIRPVLPNILSEGDLINISALVHNYTDISSKTTVSLKTNAGQVKTPLSQKINILPNDFVQTSWQLKVGKAGIAKLEFSVKDENGRSDTVIQTIDIRSPGYWVQSSEFKNGPGGFNLSKPTEPFDTQKTSLNLSLSTTILGSLPSAMTYLINYPYGCTEQTTSGLLAKIISKKYPTVFYEALKKQSNQDSIDSGIEKLANLQNSDGGWPWWGGESNSFVTAYVYRLITEARKIGVNVDDSLFTNALKYLQNNYDKDDLETKVTKAYGLSFSNDPKLYKTINQGLETLESDHLAMAVVANITSGLSDPNQNGLELLLSKAQTTDSGIYWAAGKTERFGSVESSTALAIQALLKSNNYYTQAAKAINYLMKNRRFDYWASGYATAQTILAVTDYSQLKQETKTDLVYTVSYNDKTLKTGKIVGFQNTPIEINIDPKIVSKSGNLVVSTKGSGEIYSTLTQKWWLTNPISEKESHGVTITKQIVNSKGEEYNLVPGDLVNVKLTITFDPNTQGKNGYAVIEDRLPSGLIPINTNLKNESNNNSSYDYSSYLREYLTDGIIIPIHYNNGSSVYTYQARVINSGSFNVPPAYYSLMYYPEVWARSESSTLGVDTVVKIDPTLRVKEAFQKITTKEKSSVIIFIVSTIGVGLIIFGAAIYVKKKLNN